MYSISKYCRISNGSLVVDNEQLVIDNDKNDFVVFIKSIYKKYKVGYPKFFKMDNLSKLGFITAEILLDQTNIKSKYNDDEIAIVLENGASTIDIDTAYQETINDRNNYFPSPSLFVYTLPNIMSGEISIRHKIKGENTIFVSENFDVSFLHQYITDLFESSIIKCAITGWVDFDINTYKSSMFLVEKTENIKVSNKEIREFSPEIIRTIYSKL